MSSSRLKEKWKKVKEWCSSASDSQAARVAYSTGAGCSAGGSILYVSTVLSSCIPPPFSCCIAGTVAVGVGAHKYHQITNSNDRMGQLEKENESLKNEMKELKEELTAIKSQSKRNENINFEVEYTAAQCHKVLDTMVERMEESPDKDEYQRILSLPQEEAGGYAVRYQDKITVSDSSMLGSVNAVPTKDSPRSKSASTHQFFKPGDERSDDQKSIQSKKKPTETQPLSSYYSAHSAYNAMDDDDDDNDPILTQSNVFGMHSSFLQKKPLNQSMMESELVSLGKKMSLKQ